MSAATQFDLFPPGYPKTLGERMEWAALLDQLVGPKGSEVRVHPCTSAGRDVPWEGTLVGRYVNAGNISALVVVEAEEFMHGMELVRHTIKWEHVSHVTVLRAATNGDHEGRPVPALERPH